MRAPVLILSAALGAASLAPAQLAGAYAVGPGGSFPDLAAAITALAANGVAGPVTFTVTGNQSGSWTLTAFPGQGPANPVVFDGGGTVALAGPQPVLTLAGCASVTFRGFTGTFTATPAPSAIVVTGSTADCAFAACSFHAPPTTSVGQPLLALDGGSGLLLEDCAFGGGYEALYSGPANSGTTVQRCRIRGGGGRIARIGGADFELVDNVITGGSDFGIHCGLSGSPASAPNLKIRHNSFHQTHQSTTGLNQHCSLRWYTSAPGTEVVDNVFVDHFPGFPGHNVWCSGANRPAVMDFNCFWSGNAAYSPVYAGANLTLAGWQALGFDANSIQADPLYVAPAATPPDLRLQAASPCATAGTLLPPVPYDFVLAPRTVPVSLGAFEQDNAGSARYAVFGAGCAGSAGTPTNTVSALPRLGTTPLLTFGNLPAPNLAVAILGLANTGSGAGPLPLPLGFLGMPLCSLRVRPDVTLTVAGAAGSGSVPFPIPNDPALAGFTFHTQALVLDPGLNAFGASMSDAATAVIGP